MADSVRQKIRAEMATRLAAITTGAGYQTTFNVYEDQIAAENSNAQIAAYVTFGDEEGDIGNRGLSGDQPMVVLLQVHCYVRKSATLIDVQEDALQDLRNKMQTSLDGWKTTTGAAFMGFDTCETDEGVLAFDNLAFFTQSLAFIYRAGPTW